MSYCTFWSDRHIIRDGKNKKTLSAAFVPSLYSVVFFMRRTRSIVQEFCVDFESNAEFLPNIIKLSTRDSPSTGGRNRYASLFSRS